MLLLVPAIFFAVIWILPTDLMLKGIETVNNNYLYLSHPIHGPLRIFYVLYETIFLLAAFSIITYKWFKYPGQDRKYMLSLILWGGLSVPPILIFEQWLPLLGVSTLLSLAPNIMLIGLFPVVYTILNYSAFKITPQVAASQILGSLGKSIAVYDVSGQPLYQGSPEALPPKEEIQKIIDAVIARGSVKNYHTFINEKPVIASARFFKGGGGIIIVFHEVSELELLLEKESVIKQKLSHILQKEKVLSETLIKIASAGAGFERNRIVLEVQSIFGNEPDLLALINKTKTKAEEKIQLINNIEADSVSLPQRTDEAEKINKAGIARELQMIELKQKIAALKKLKANNPG
jgi:hypothetical protein